MDSLADRGTSYTRAYAAGIPTYFSFKSLLGGIPSLGYSRDIGMPSDATTLAEAFSEAGYVTAGFNAGNPWLTRAYGYQRGFDIYRDFLTDEPDDRSRLRSGADALLQVLRSLVESSEITKDVVGRVARTSFALADRTPLEPAETVTDAALEWLDDRHDPDRPFFLWIHYMDPHYPWVPRQRDLEPFREDSISRTRIGTVWHEVSHRYKESDGTESLSDAEMALVRDLYDAEVRRCDDALDTVLSKLSTLGALEETLIAVVGDHGTELQDHGGFSHGPRTLYDEVTRVPLLLAGPSVPVDHDQSVRSLEDLPATILDRAGIGAPLSQSFPGESMFDDSRESVVTEVVYDFEPASGANRENGLLVSVVDWPWKLVVNRAVGETELYRLDLDPAERSDRSITNPNRVSELRVALEDYRDRIERTNRTLAERERVRTRVAELRARGTL